jgi:hypothetical protein
VPVPTDRSLKTFGDMTVNLEYTDMSNQFFVLVALLSEKELEAHYFSWAGDWLRTEV